MHTLAMDVDNYLDEADTAIGSTRTGPLGEAMDNLDGIDAAIDGARRELRYCSEQLEEWEELVDEWGNYFDEEPSELHEEIEAWRSLGNEYGDVEEITAALEEASDDEELKSEVEELRKQVESQKEAIRLLQLLNGRQASMIGGARRCLVADPVTGLTESQAEYMHSLRNEETVEEPIGPQSVDEIEWPVDANGSPVDDSTPGQDDDKYIAEGDES